MPGQDFDIEQLLSERLRQEMIAKLTPSLFDRRDAEEVVTWLESTRGRRPVVVVGAGFTFNARSRVTGTTVARNLIPDWERLTKMWAAAIGDKPNNHEPTLLAELYRNKVGENQYINSMREALPDATLQAGPAHEALFKYPAAAIITTNNLDTVLDEALRAADWKKVVEDDQIPLQESRELIYMHGHRDDPATWVFTKTEYETYREQRPLMTTKIRQLLAQHPVLVVGFGLTDPNFHHLYNEIGRETSYRQPLGLALMVSDSINEAVRNHWRDKGLRLARLAPGNMSYCDAFARFFGIAPLTDDRSQVEADLADELLGRLSDLGDAVEFLEQFHAYRRRAQAPDGSDEEKARSAQRDIHRMFHALLVECSDELREELTRKLPLLPEDLGPRYSAFLTAEGQRSDPTPAPSLQVLPGDRFSIHDELTRAVDHVLRSRAQGLELIARWLTVWLSDEEARAPVASAYQDVMLDLTSWVWITMAHQTKPSSEQWHSVLRRVEVLCRLHGLTDLQRRIAEDAQSVDPEWDCDLDSWAGVAPGTAAYLILDGETALAAERYQALARAASGDQWLEWARLLGVQWCERSHRVEKDGATTSMTDVELEQLALRIDELADSPIVCARARSILNEQREAAERGLARTLEDKSTTFGDASEVWKRYRYLLGAEASFGELRCLAKTMYLADGEPRSWLELGLDWEGGSGRRALATRIKAALKQPNAPAIRNTATRWILHQGPQHRRGLLNRLSAVPALAPVLTEESAAQIPGLVRRCTERVGRSLEDATGWSQVFPTSYVEALKGHAKATSDAQWLDGWRQLSEWAGRADVAASAHSMPWDTSWVLDEARRPELKSEVVALAQTWRESMRRPAPGGASALWPVATLVRLEEIPPQHWDPSIKALALDALKVSLSSNYVP